MHVWPEQEQGTKKEHGGWLLAIGMCRFTHFVFNGFVNEVN